MDNQVVVKTAVRKKKYYAKRREYSPTAIVFLTLGSVIMVFPFIWALSGSLAGTTIAIYQKEFFKSFNWENYAIVFKEANFLTYSVNSFVLAAINIIGHMISNSFIGFGFAKYNFKGSNVLFFAALCTMFLPGTVMTVPMYVVWSKLHLTNTYVPLTIGAFFGAAMDIFLMRQCFKSLPGGLYEAALIDGAHPIIIYARIYMPLARPMLATLGLRTFIGSWNSLFGPLVYITSKEKYTIPLGLQYLKTKYELEKQNLLMAAAILAMLPTLIVYIFTQKQFVAGMASAAIKG